MSGQGSKMQLSLIVRGQHPPGDITGHLRDDLELVRRADRLGFDGIVKGSHYSAHPFEYVQQIPFLDFLDPWGNRIEVVEYSNIQFTKAPNVQRGMGLTLAKNDNAKKELAEKGMAPE